ncbi:MAG: outer membrane beta-barrel protein [Candidatus Kapaibacterium sp.]
MKKISIMLAAFFCLLLLYSETKSAPLLEIGFYGGLSTPNDKINDIYNKDMIEEEDFVGNIFTEGVSAGYHLGVKGRLPLSDNVSFFGSISFNRFPESEIKFRDPETDSVLAVFTTNQNIVPIAAGVQYYLFKSFINLYATGELDYNYISSSVDYKYGDVDVPISRSPADNRLGYGLGLGFDVDITLLRLNLETRYNHINLIGKDDDEEDKTYITVSVGVYF